MDKKIANQIIVGMFVTVAFFGFIFIIFNISGGDGLFSSKYSLFARFKHVKGLHYGSEVSLAGLRVGVVKSISIGKDDPKILIVELAIDKKMKDRVRKDSIASVKTQGVLGDKYIEISIGTPAEPELAQNSEIVVEEEQDIFSKGGMLVDEVKRQFEKGGEVEGLIHNLNLLSKNLTAMSSDVKKERGLLNEMIYGRSGPKLGEAVAHLNGILKKIDQGEGSLGLLVNDPTVYEDIKTMTGGAKRSTILKALIRSFSESGTDAKEKVK